MGCFSPHLLFAARRRLPSSKNPDGTIVGKDPSGVLGDLPRVPVGLDDE
jgi:hypothetical protein